VRVNGFSSRDSLIVGVGMIPRERSALNFASWRGMLLVSQAIRADGGAGGSYNASSRPAYEVCLSSRIAQGYYRCYWGG